MSGWKNPCKDQTWPRFCAECGPVSAHLAGLVNTRFLCRLPAAQFIRTWCFETNGSNKLIYIYIYVKIIFTNDKLSASTGDTLLSNVVDTREWGYKNNIIMCPHPGHRWLHRKTPSRCPEPFSMRDPQSTAGPQPGRCDKTCFWLYISLNMSPQGAPASGSAGSAPEIQETNAPKLVWYDDDDDDGIQLPMGDENWQWLSTK